MTLIGNIVDSIESPQTTHQPIPPAVLNADALLAYKAGNSWLTWAPYNHARPDLADKGWIVSVTLTCLASARMYDIESGGGQNRNIGVFMKNADRSHGLPILYTFASNGQAMLNTARGFGYKQGRDFYYLAAHPGVSHQHMCSPQTCGYPRADGTQNVFAGAVDYSLFEDYMLPKVKRHPKPPAPKPDEFNPAFNAAYKSMRELGRKYRSPRGRSGLVDGAGAGLKAAR